MMLNTACGMQTMPASVGVSTEGSQEITDRSSMPARFVLPLPLMGVSLKSWQSESTEELPHQ